MNSIEQQILWMLVQVSLSCYLDRDFKIIILNMKAIINQ